MEMLDEVRPVRVSAPTVPLFHRAGQGNTHRSDDLIVPFFRLMVDDRAVTKHSSRSGDRSAAVAEWCSSPEFCQFTGRSEFNVTPPPAA